MRQHNFFFNRLIFFCFSNDFLFLNLYFSSFYYDFLSHWQGFFISFINHNF